MAVFSHEHAKFTNEQMFYGFRHKPEFPKLYTKGDFCSDETVIRTPDFAGGGD
jgi:hypothetical protein